MLKARIRSLGLEILEHLQRYRSDKKLMSRTGRSSQIVETPGSTFGRREGNVTLSLMNGDIQFGY